MNMRKRRSSRQKQNDSWAAIIGLEGPENHGRIKEGWAKKGRAGRRTVRQRAGRRKAAKTYETLRLLHFDDQYVRSRRFHVGTFCALGNVICGGLLLIGRYGCPRSVHRNCDAKTAEPKFRFPSQTFVSLRSSSSMSNTAAIRYFVDGEGFTICHL